MRNDVPLRCMPSTTTGSDSRGSWLRARSMQRLSSWQRIAELLEQRTERCTQARDLLAVEARRGISHGTAAHEAQTRGNRGLQVGLVEDADALVADIGRLDLAQAGERGIGHGPLDVGGTAVGPHQARELG